MTRVSALMIPLTALALTACVVLSPVDQPMHGTLAVLRYQAVRLQGACGTPSVDFERSIFLRALDGGKKHIISEPVRAALDVVESTASSLNSTGSADYCRLKLDIVINELDETMRLAGVLSK